MSELKAPAEAAPRGAGARSSVHSGFVIDLVEVCLDFPRYRTSGGSLRELATRRFTARRGPRTFRALSNVSLQVPAGEVIGVIGPNGGGKSTLLRVIAGIYQPDEGTVTTQGRISLLSGLGAGFEGHLTGKENIFLGASVLGLKRAIVRERLPEIVDLSGLEQFLDQPLRTYSSGMRARLGFAIAATLEPTILLLDEVFGVGDLAFAQRSRQRIEEIAASSSTVVIVSHQFDVLRRLCSRVAVVRGGHLKVFDDPEAAIETYRSYPASRT